MKLKLLELMFLMCLICPTQNTLKLKSPAEMRLFLLGKKTQKIQRLLFFLKTSCLLSKLLSEMKGNHFPAESGHWWIGNDEMTRMSVNWVFDAGSNWMRGCEPWKANSLWSGLFYDTLYSLVDVWEGINESWKMSVFPFKHFQKHVQQELTYVTCTLWLLSSTQAAGFVRGEEVKLKLL